MSDEENETRPALTEDGDDAEAHAEAAGEAGPQPGDDVAPEPAPEEHTNGTSDAAHVRVAEHVTEKEPWKRLFTKTPNAQGVQIVNKTAENALVLLQHHPDWRGKIALDGFHDRIVLTGAPPWRDFDMPMTKHAAWKDSYSSRFQGWIERIAKLKISLEACTQAIVRAAEANEFHPVRDYLRACARKWAEDKEPRLDALFVDYFGAVDGEYTRAIARTFLIGAVARVMRPGCQLDTLPIIEGPQGLGKSSACRILAGEWFSDSTISLGDKDSYQQLRGKWIYELSELDALRRGDVSRVKAFISAPSDHYRPSYGRFAIDVPRQTVFVGTTNKERYLSDSTGNRRFNPVRASRIAFKALEQDRDLIWGEAFTRFEGGEPWHLTGRLVALAAEEQEARRDADPWEEQLAAWLATSGQRFVTTGELLDKALNVEPKDRGPAHTKRIADVLHRLGWRNARPRVDGVKTRGFVAPGEPEP